MIKNIFTTITNPRNRWRNISFSELSELYIASMLRNLAISIVGIFIPIYLYQANYSIVEILFFFSIFYFSGIIGINHYIGKLVARYGPKHVMRISFPLHIISFIIFATTTNHFWPIWLMAIIFRVACSCYFLPHHVAFSKAKTSKHGGKQLGVLNIFEKIAGIVGPLLGGIVATIFGAQSIMIVSSIIFMLAIIPLMLSREPIKTNKKFSYRGLNIRKIRRHLLMNAIYNTENGLKIWLWPLYIGIFIFTTNPYLNLGIVSTLGTIIAIFAAILVGKLVDSRHGHELLKFSAVLNAAAHVSRLLVTGFGSIVILNLVNEPTTVSYQMAFMKGYYDTVDENDEFRVAYVVLSEIVMDLLRGSVWLALTLAALIFPNSLREVITSGFVVAAIFSLLVLLQQFPALAKRN